MLTISVKLEVKTHLHARAWEIACESYPQRKNQRDQLLVRDAAGDFEVEMTQTSITVKGPV